MELISNFSTQQPDKHSQQTVRPLSVYSRSRFRNGNETYATNYMVCMCCAWCHPFKVQKIHFMKKKKGLGYKRYHNWYTITPRIIKVKPATVQKYKNIIKIVFPQLYNKAVSINSNGDDPAQLAESYKHPDENTNQNREPVELQRGHGCTD